MNIGDKIIVKYNMRMPYNTMYNRAIGQYGEIFDIQQYDDWNYAVYVYIDGVSYMFIPEEIQIVSK